MNELTSYFCLYLLAGMLSFFIFRDKRIVDHTGAILFIILWPLGLTMYGVFSIIFMLSFIIKAPFKLLSHVISL